MCGGHLHFLVDVGSADVKGAAENAGEGQHVINLVREVRAARSDDGCAAGLGLVGHDLGRWVGASEEDRILGHGPDHLGRDRAGSGNADEHVRIFDYVRELTGLLLTVGDERHFLLDPVEILTSLVDRAGAVGHDDVPEARRQQQLDDGDRRSARARGDDLHVLLLFADNLQGIGQTGEGDDGGAVLIVVENGNVAALLELALDFEAARRGNILKIDAAEGAGDQRHGVDKFVHILGLDAEREGIHAAEGLEQHAFALHDGHAGLGADVSQTENSRAVGDDGAEVVAAGQVIGAVDILLDLEAGLRDAGRIGKGEIVLGRNRNGGDDFDFSLPLLMELEGFFCVVHKKSLLYGCTTGSVEPP